MDYFDEIRKAQEEADRTVFELKMELAEKELEYLQAKKKYEDRVNEFRNRNN